MEKDRIKFRSRFIFNRSGQATIEAVLLATVMLSIFFLATKKLREKQVLQNMTNKSVGSIKNMSEFGSWKQICKPPRGPGNATAAKCHPNSITRSLSSDPQ